MSEQVARKLDIKQICFIDDSKTSAFVTKKLLKKHGYMVDHFSNAESALEALMEFDYALLITDLMISAEGGVNGDDLIRLIRQSGHPVKSHIPIVVVTGSSDLATHDNLLHVGADRVLPKPLDGKTLQQTIEELAPQIAEVETTELPVVSLKNKPQPAVEDQAPPKAKITFTFDESDELKGLGEEVSESGGVKKESAISQRLEELSELAAFSDTPTNEEHLSADDLLGFSETGFARYSDDKEKIEPVKVPAPLEEAAEDLELEDLLKKVPPVERINIEKPVIKDSLEDFLKAVPVIEEPDNEALEKENLLEELLKDEALLQKPAIEEEPVIKESKDDIEIPVLTETYRHTPAEPVVPVKREESQPQPEREVENSEELLSRLLNEMEQQESIQTPAPAIEKIHDESPVVEKKQPVKPAEKTEQKTSPEKKTDFARQSYQTEEENPLLGLLGHLEEEKVEYDRNQPFKSASIFSSKWVQRGFWAVLLIALIAPAVYFWMQGQSSIAVSTTSVTAGNLATRISVPGRVVSKRKINVTARSAGQVMVVAVKEGDRVEKGQLLVQMDDKDALSVINRGQAQLLSIQETVAQTSKLQERLQKALDVGAVSRQRVEDAEAAWKTASAKQSVVEEELKAAKLALQRLKITAPFDGMITSVTVQEGQWVAPAAPLLNIVDMNQRLAEVRVDVSDSGNLSVGQPITISSDAFAGKEWDERITKISSEASREDSANIIKVYASLDNSPDDLRIGQQLDAEIRTAVRSNTLQIPFNVLFTHQGRPTVAIIENSKIKFIPVVLGIESASSVEVIEGLREGQKVVIPSGVPLTEGMTVVVAGSDH